MVHLRTCVCGAFLALFSFTSALPTQTTSDIASRPLVQRTAASVYASEASAGIVQLQTWYKESDGLWNQLWWNSANALTMLADFQEKFPNMVEPVTANVFPNTLAHAPSYGNYAGFLNGYYDDEMWWCLAWIKVYDITNNSTYLDTASSIFENAKSVWGSTPCGGLWWDKAHTSVNAIANSLYFTAASKLANRKPHTPSSGYYYNEAIRAVDWILASGLINSQNLLNDGLNLTTCKNNGQTTWSYNQGALLGGLVELTWSSGDAKYATLANTIASATLAHLTDAHGILQDPCGSCAGDGGQFKGVFARNLQFLVDRSTVLPAATRAAFVAFLETNADAVWRDDRSAAGARLGPVWSGPYQAADVQTQSSALDLLVGAAGVA